MSHFHTTGVVLVPGITTVVVVVVVVVAGILFENKKLLLFGQSVCVFVTSNRSLYPSTSSKASVRADSSILERYNFCGHKTTP